MEILIKILAESTCMIDFFVKVLYIYLKLLNVQQLIDRETATLIYKSQHNLTPQYISDMFVPSGVVHSHNTRHSVNGLFIPRTL